MTTRKLDTQRLRRPKASRRVKAAAIAKETRTGLLDFGSRVQEVVDLTCPQPGQSRGSRTAFAKLLGVTTSHVSKWCDHGTAPTAPILARIARKTGISIDWLLGVPHAAQFHTQARSSSSLEADVAAYVEREITKRVPPPDTGEFFPPGTYRWHANGGPILGQVVADLEPVANRAVHLETSTPGVLDKMTGILEMAEALVAAGPNELASEAQATAAAFLADVSGQGISDLLSEFRRLLDDGRLVLYPNLALQAEMRVARL